MIRYVKLTNNFNRSLLTKHAAAYDGQSSHGFASCLYSHCSGKICPRVQM